MIVLNEKEYAEKCLKEGIVDKNPYQVVSILAKYYCHHCRFKRKKIVDLLIDYLNKYYPRYEINKSQWISTTEKLAANAGKQPLYEFSGIKITRDEIEVIKGIHEKTLEKFAFTSLCIAKFYNLKNPRNNGWVNTKTEEVYKTAHISCTIYEQDVKLNKLHLLGLVEFPKQNDNLNYRVTFAQDDGKEELFISDFRELGYEYLNYLGEDFIRCVDCGILTPKGKTNRKKYCEKHGSQKETKKEKIIFCEDCGKPIEIDAKNNRKTKCDTCYEDYRRKYYREYKRKRRELKKMSTV